MVIGHINIGFTKAQMPQQVKGGIHQFFARHTQYFGAEVLPQSPLVEHKSNVKRRPERRFNFIQLCWSKSVTNQRRMVDCRCVADAAVTHGIAHNFFNLRTWITQFFQRSRYRLVDDLKVTATSKFLELHQRKVGLDAGGVTIHHQTNCAGWRHDRRLRVAISMTFSQRQRLVPTNL